MKKYIILFVVSCIFNFSHAQELQVNLSVMSNRVSTQVDKKTFQTLQTALSNFLNNRKWTNQQYQAHERIRCNFLLNIEQEVGQNLYKASLTVQAARPIYNTTYESPLLNIQDNDVVFRYVEFQPIEFNDNRVQGTDPLAANLTAILAYYSYIILGLDHASFSPRGGDVYFQRALNIVNNAPESRDLSGWKTFDGVRNRFRMVENLTDSRFALVHDAVYSYYRTGLDMFFENEQVARTGVLNALNSLSTLNRDIPNSMILQVFFQGKTNEIARLFSKADADTRSRAKDLLLKLDVTNASVYRQL
jgi:hypothetical protein